MIVVTEEELELYHSGIKGMKWGIRRYQYADGTLTPAGRKRYMKNPKWRKKYIEQQKAKIRAAETKEQRHERLMNSNDANELYKYKHELTTAEIKERIERIKTEQDLAKYVKQEPTRMDRVKQITETIMSNGEKVAKFIDSPAGKQIMNTIKAQVGIGPDTKKTNYERELKRISELTDREVQDLTNRARNERSLRQIIDELNGNANTPRDTRSAEQVIQDALNDSRIDINDWAAREALEEYLRSR